MDTSITLKDIHDLVGLRLGPETSNAGAEGEGSQDGTQAAG
jgi:hypothetical protein